MERNASVYQDYVYPVSRTTDKEWAETIRPWGAGFEQEGAGDGMGGAGAAQSVRGNSKSFEGTSLTVVEGMHQCIMYSLSCKWYTRRGAGEVFEGRRGG